MAEPRTVRENANSLTSEDIAAILPHRYPFALVDRILDYEPGNPAAESYRNLASEVLRLG